MREYVSQKRLPFAPLRRAVGDLYVLRDERSDKSRFRGLSGQTAQAALTGVLAELVGVNRKTIQRWAMAGVPDDQADRVACALGMHPSEIWPTWFGPYGLTV